VGAAGGFSLRGEGLLFLDEKKTRLLL